MFLNIYDLSVIVFIFNCDGVIFPLKKSLFINDINIYFIHEVDIPIDYSFTAVKIICDNMSVKLLD